MNREISFYQYLTPEEQDLLDRSMQQVPCRKSQVVHRHGDSCVGLIFVRKGRLAFSILSEEGREITVFRIEKGESCILSAACVLQSLEFESHITAEVNSEIAILPAPTLSQLMNSNPDVERLVYKQAVIQYSGVLPDHAADYISQPGKAIGDLFVGGEPAETVSLLFRDP